MDITRESLSEMTDGLVLAVSEYYNITLLEATIKLTSMLAAEADKMTRGVIDGNIMGHK